jgi:hypothetical protein
MAAGAQGPGLALGALLGISQLVYLGAMATLGGRLLRRARRSRELPEGLLALHFLLCCTVGYLLMGGALAAVRQPGLLPSAVIPVLLGTGQVLSGCGVWAAVAFTWLVFRREQAWARHLAAGFAAATVAGWAGAALGGGFGGDVENAWFRAQYALYTAAAVWVLYEPLRYWRLVRRRLQLGLADPILVNRFLLWGGGSVLRFAMLVAGGIPVVWPSTAADMRAGSVVLCATAVLGLGVAAAYWLTFFPPASFTRRLARRAAG